METLQQHEWLNKYNQYTGELVSRKCKHCEVFKIYYHQAKTYKYIKKDLMTTWAEPPCITRHPDKEAGKDG